ncbi:hypothetical protein T484DRAFT_1757202 [Baffinella frigidus]|nr:hypothetical protein T484DRAFT_1757202 [Cryptophyta sp. CCMP2293]
MLLHTAPARFSEKRKQDDSAPTPPLVTEKKPKKMAPTVTLSMDDDTTSTEMEEDETEDCDDNAKKEKKKPVERKHKCTHSECNESRDKPVQLQWHVDFKHKNIFHNVCGHIIDKEKGTTCGFKCERPGELTRHKRHKHSKLRLYKCKDCPKTFKQAQARDDHWNAVCSPIGDPARTKYKCKICEKGFPNRSNCNEHYIHNCCPKNDPEREAFLDRNRKAANARYAKSELVRVKKALRAALRRLLKKAGLGKTTRSEAMLGCTYKQLVAHLNDNDRGLVYGDPNMVPHIDHIRPMANFEDLKCRLEIHECANFNNLQLLPGPENLRKGASFTSVDQVAYAVSKGYRAIVELRKGWRAAGVCTCENCTSRL